jgi:hypothetical protein
MKNGVLGNYGFPAGEVADKVTFGQFGEEYRPRQAPSDLYSGMTRPLDGYNKASW